MKPITGRFVLGATLAFFGTVFAVNAVMMRVAISTMPGVEVDSAYGASLAYASAMAEARQQDERGWSVDVHVERHSGGDATVQIDARDSKAQPIAGLAVQCRFARPTDRRADLAVMLTETSAGIYRGNAAGLALGQWDLVIEGRAAERLAFVSRNRMSFSHE